jgi:hypothetical protein
MITWAHGGTSVPDFAAVIARYPRSEFASPRRSTIPLLAYWQAGLPRLRDFSAAIGEAVGASTQFHFEYRVPVQSGSGKASCTDLMVLGDGPIIAIEAKFKENRYQDVGTWLGTPEIPNRLAVLQGWLTLLSRCADRELTVSSVRALPYQLIHRAASVCQPNGRNRWMVYQLFEPSRATVDSYRSDVQGLAELMGSERRVSFAVIECGIRRWPRYSKLEAEWDGGARDVSTPILEGLLAGDLLSVAVGAVTAV